jgi:DNA-binding HxlR family transcriptional regulator
MAVLILRDALRGVTRFDDFHERLQCSRPTISDRLARFVERGILARVPYSEHPPRDDYQLTDMGRALGPTLMMMSQWADAWIPVPNGFAIKRIHTTCGHTFQPVLHCSECGEPVRPNEVKYLDAVEARNAD